MTPEQDARLRIVLAELSRVGDGITECIGHLQHLLALAGHLLGEARELTTK